MKRYLILIFILFVLVFFSVLPKFRNQETLVLDDRVRAEQSGSFIQLEQGIVHYEIGGPIGGEPVVLIHGFSIPYYVWDPTFDDLVNQGYRVLRYDLYGRGFSDRPDAVYNYALFEEQLLQLLDATQFSSPFHLMGLSMGGALASEFTINQSQRVSDLVLIAPFHEKLNISILALKGIGEYTMNAFLAPSLQNVKGDFYNYENYPEWPDKFAVQMQYKGFKRAILSTLRSYMNKDKSAIFKRLGTLQKPILLIWGKEDDVVPFETRLEVADKIHSDNIWITNAAHLPHYEYPEIVNSHLLNFLEDNSIR